MILIKGGNKTMNWLNRNVEVSEAFMMLSMHPFKYQVVGEHVDHDADPNAFKYYLVSKGNHDKERHLIITYEAYRYEEPKDDCEEVDEPKYDLRTPYFKNQSDAYMAKGILEDMIKKNGFITCAEYYNTCRRPTTQEDNEYGWIWNDHFQIRVLHQSYVDTYDRSSSCIDIDGPYILKFSTRPIRVNFVRDKIKVYDFVFPNKKTVNNILQIAKQEISRKGQLSVRYYFNLAASSTNCTIMIDYGDYKYEQYGWKDLDHVIIKKVKTGYMIIMPDAYTFQQGVSESILLK